MDCVSFGLIFPLCGIRSLDPVITQMFLGLTLDTILMSSAALHWDWALSWNFQEHGLSGLWTIQ